MSSPDAPLYVKKLSEDARLPVKGSADAAGYDLFAARQTLVPARGKALVPTDLAVALPGGTYGRIAPRSGLAWKHSLDVGAGVVDADFRGAVGIVLFNHGDRDYTVSQHERAAQLVVEKIQGTSLHEVAELPETVRGAGGFGSTGQTS